MALTFVASMLLAADQTGFSGSEGILIVYTEGRFPARRLHEILRARSSRDASHLMESVFVEEIAEDCDFWDFLAARLPKLMTTVKVCLLFVAAVALHILLFQNRQDS